MLYTITFCITKPLRENIIRVHSSPPNHYAKTFGERVRCIVPLRVMGVLCTAPNRYWTFVHRRTITRKHYMSTLCTAEPLRENIIRVHCAPPNLYVETYEYIVHRRTITQKHFWEEGFFSCGLSEHYSMYWQIVEWHGSDIKSHCPSESSS